MKSYAVRCKACDQELEGFTDGHTDNNYIDDDICNSCLLAISESENYSMKEYVHYKTTEGGRDTDIGVLDPYGYD